MRQPYPTGMSEVFAVQHEPVTNKVAAAKWFCPTSWLIDWIDVRLLGTRLICLGIGVDLVGALVILACFEEPMLQGACVAFLLVLATLRVAVIRSLDPFAVLFFAWSLVFIEVPVAVIGARPSALEVDAGLAITIPRPSDASCAESLMLLAGCFVAVVFAVAAVRIRDKPEWHPGAKGARRMFICAMLMLIVSVGYDFALAGSRDAMRGWTRSAVEFFKFISFDTALMIVLFLLLLEPFRPRNSGSVVRSIRWMSLATAFVALYSFIGSKGAILTLLFAAIVFPLSLGAFVARRYMLVPRMYVLVVLALVSIPLFGFVSNLRSIRKLSPEASVVQTVVMATEAPFDLSATGEIISQRISIPLFRYLVLWDRFRIEAPLDHWDKSEYFVYTGDSLLNLVLPGTPFEACYAPSSSLLEPLLAGSDLISVPRDQYLLRLNSQPTTIFGLLIVAMGWFAPIGAFLLAAAARLAFNARAPGVWFAALFVFYASLSCYGLDAALQIAISAGLTFAILCRAGRVGSPLQWRGPCWRIRARGGG